MSSDISAPWRPIDTAPDNELFDGFRNGIRYTDCFIDELGRHCKKHGYPSSTRIFLDPLQFWMPRPPQLLEPYCTNEEGEKYIPQCETEFDAAR